MQTLSASIPFVSKRPAAATGLPGGLALLCTVALTSIFSRVNCLSKARRDQTAARRTDAGENPKGLGDVGAPRP